MRNRLTAYHYGHHPFDVVGWDGYLWPYAFNIGDFEPITGRVHQPPPVHQTFAARNFVVCSFVPRKFDYHPLAIPAPYNHSNINSDEVIYYVAGNFMSRRGVGISSFTLHPAGIPHGPHPGTAEASIGKEATEELAVMVDTFHPLKITSRRRPSRTPGTRIPGSRPRTPTARLVSSTSAGRRRSRTERRSAPDDRIEEWLQLVQRTVLCTQQDDDLVAVDPDDDEPAHGVRRKSETADSARPGWARTRRPCHASGRRAESRPGRPR